MIRIAICDDEQSMVRQNEEIVRNSLQACGIGYEIITYSQSTNLLCDIIEDKFFYDLILLDIEMPEISGMELAGRIKEALPNVKIIFITSHVEYAIDAYELSIFILCGMVKMQRLHQYMEFLRCVKVCNRCMRS